jgi:5-methylthioadenosine/S-adenosylhomocysteine deaminase
MSKCYGGLPAKGSETVSMTILIRNASYLLIDPTRTERHWDVLVDGSRIIQAGPGLSVPAEAQIIDASGCAVLPGLINSHTHLYQNFLKGISAGIPLVSWCNEVLFPAVGVLREAVKADRRIPYLWTMLAAAEMIKGGVTCCINMDVTYPETLQAWQEAGFRGVMAYTLVNKWVPAHLMGREEEMREKALHFVRQYHRPQDLTQVFLAPSTVFLCDDGLLRWAGEQARALDLGVQIHVSETAGEVADSVKETGMRPVERLARTGLLDERMSAVHCVHVQEDEIERLAESGAVVVHCPKSNMKLADGIAPVPAMKAAGIPLAVATDGCASNDLLDMWEEMRAAVLLARVSRQDAAALSPQDALRMATVDAARAARIDAGAVYPGKLADLIVVNLNAAHLQPFHDLDLCNMLVFCARAGDVRDTLIHGRVVMRDRRLTTIDESQLVQAAAELDRHLFRRRQEFHFRNEEMTH